MIFSLNDSEAALVIESLAHCAERYRRIASDSSAGYPPEVQKNQLATAVRAHDLAQLMSDQIAQTVKNRKWFDTTGENTKMNIENDWSCTSQGERSEQQQHDVYEVNDWNPNDPRNW